MFETLKIDRVVERWWCLECGHDDHRSTFALVTRTAELSVLWDDG